MEGAGVGDREGWVAVPGHDGLVKEVKERTVKTREEKEERLETEDVQHLGDISDQVSVPSNCTYYRIAYMKNNKIA